MIINLLAYDKLCGIDWFHVTKLFALPDSKQNVKNSLYVCIYKMVNVYLGVSFSDADERNTSCQSFDDEISLIESQSMIAWTEHWVQLLHRRYPASFSSVCQKRIETTCSWQGHQVLNAR